MIIDEIGGHDGRVRPGGQIAGQRREAFHPLPDGLVPPLLPLPGALVEDGFLGMDQRSDAVAFVVMEEIAYAPSVSF